MYRDPTKEDLESPVFNAIWECIKEWDINVPEEYEGYAGASGNHVCAILDALKDSGLKFNVETNVKRE